MDKHPDDLLTGDGDPFKGDPNFMASLARGLEVIQAFTPQRPLLSLSPAGWRCSMLLLPSASG